MIKSRGYLRLLVLTSKEGSSMILGTCVISLAGQPCQASSQAGQVPFHHRGLGTVTLNLTGLPYPEGSDLFSYVVTRES